MAELTDEQIELAAKAAFKCFNYAGNWNDRPIPSESMKECYRKAVRTAAPFLQLPWDDPTRQESDSIHEGCERSGFFLLGSKREMHTLQWFVRKRNAALQPKPVDPRREKILSVLRKRDWPLDIVEEMKLVDRMIAALDEVK